MNSIVADLSYFHGVSSVSLIDNYYRKTNAYFYRLKDKIRSNGDLILASNIYTRNIAKSISHCDIGEENCVKSVYEASAAFTKLPESIVQHFNFCPVESSLCLGLIQGKPLDDVADESGQPRELLRAYFHKLLMKTDTDNEAKLVSVLLSLSDTADSSRLRKRKP